MPHVLWIMHLVPEAQMMMVHFMSHMFHRMLWGGRQINTAYLSLSLRYSRQTMYWAEKPYATFKRPSLTQTSTDFGLVKLQSTETANLPSPRCNIRFSFGVML
jgi:hypothetical protein